MTFKDLVSDFVGSLAADLFSMGHLKKILTRGVTSKITGKGEGEATDSKDAGGPKVVMGGMFNLSDEIAYSTLISKLGDQENKSGQKVSIVISAFLNSQHFDDAKRARFRAVIGSLGEIEYTKKKETTNETTHKEFETDTPKGKQKVVKPDTKKVEVEEKSNLGVEFLKSMAELQPNEMLEVCEAAGIMDTMPELIKKFGKNINDSFKKIEESSIAQKTMSSLTEKMREHRARIREEREK